MDRIHRSRSPFSPLGALVLAGLAVLLGAASTTGCAVALAPRLPEGLDWDEAVGAVALELDRSDPPGASRTVVVLQDRHSTNPGFNRLRPQLARIQRDNRLLVDWLSRRGFGLLGCEFREGPLIEEPDTAAQYSLIRRRIGHVDENEEFLDGISIFQPIRYQLLYGDRLEVRGVEDAELYERDVALFRDYKHATATARRRDLDDEERRRQLERAAAAEAGLRESTRARGRAAARNLLEAMAASDRQRAILLVGGAHAPGAIEALDEGGAAWRLLCSRSYETLDEEDRLEDLLEPSAQ